MPRLSDNQIAEMRATVVDNLLDHVCDVSVRTEGDPDPDGHVEYVWNVVATDVPCHHWEARENEFVGAENVTVTRERLLMPANYAISNFDRIVRIRTYGGVVINAEFNVTEVLHRYADTLLMLERIQ